MADDDRPSKDDPYERHMDYRRLPFNPNRETAFSRWAKQRDNRSTNIEVRRPQTQDQVDLDQMLYYLLGNPEWREQNSAGERMFNRIPPAVGSIAHDAGVPNIRGIPSPQSFSPKYADDGSYGRVIPLPPIPDYTDDYYRDRSRPYRNPRDIESADLDPAEQIVDDVIQGKQ